MQENQKYQTYLQKFRDIQIEHDDYSQSPMSEQQFNDWKKPIKETPMRNTMLDYKTIYLRLRKLVEKKLSMDLSPEERERVETELQEMNKAYTGVAENHNLS